MNRLFNNRVTKPIVNHNVIHFNKRNTDFTKRLIIKLCPYCNLPLNRNGGICRNCEKHPITFYKMSKNDTNKKFRNCE